MISDVDVPWSSKACFIGLFCAPWLCVFACIGGRVDIVVNNAGKSERGGGYCSVKVEPRVGAFCFTCVLDLEQGLSVTLLLGE